jgi:hypothetical protein
MSATIERRDEPDATGSPHRRMLQVVQPVCAECRYRRDSKMADKLDPWRDWLCTAVPRHEWPAEYNPITGETSPGWTAWSRCTEVNANGDCGHFEPTVAPTATAESLSHGRLVRIIAALSMWVWPTAWALRITRGEG